MALFLLLQLGCGFVLGILAGVLKAPPVVDELFEIIVSLASAAILLRIALRKRVTSWRGGLPFTRFSGVLLPPLVIAVAGLHIIASETDNAVRWVMPPPTWLIHIMEKLYTVPLTTLVALVIVAPLTEESVCRGLMLGGMLRRYRARTAVLISAVIFMLIHVNPYQFVTAFTFGIVAGWIYVRTRSLWPCMIAHALMNLGPALGAIGAFPWEIEGYSKPHSPDAVLFQPLWFDALGAALAGLGLLWLYWTFRRGPKPDPQVNP